MRYTADNATRDIASPGAPHGDTAHPPHARQTGLWLSLYLPHLALDVLLRGDARPEDPVVVCDVRAGRQYIHDCNAPAMQYGIMPGMTPGAALSLHAALRVLLRDTEREADALHNIAAWAGQFTSQLSLHPPDGVLLEIAGSLRLFGSANAIQERVATNLQQLGYRARMATAPTPQGARLLSIAGNGQQALDGPALLATLRRLPVTTLQQPDDIIHKLRGIGLRSIGDCLRLPRDGLGKRFGPDFLHYLDRLLGRVDDPQVPFAAPPRFSSRIFLAAETGNIEFLLFAAQRLLVELAGCLLARGSGVQLLRLEILHHHRAATELSIGLLQASRDAGHLLKLVRERLERHVLAAPAEGIALHADEFVPLAHASDDLFVSSRAGNEPWPALLERLQVRVGSDAVHGLRPVADHRPEHAWDYCTPGASSDEAGNAPRPMWLLETPLRLVMRDGAPYMEGKLRMVRGPERIEAGWWDEDDVARDYFVAENGHAERLWVFRELTEPRRWYLHGVFG